MIYDDICYQYSFRMYPYVYHCVSIRTEHGTDQSSYQKPCLFQAWDHQRPATGESKQRRCSRVDGNGGHGDIRIPQDSHHLPSIVNTDIRYIRYTVGIQYQDVPGIPGCIHGIYMAYLDISMSFSNDVWSFAERSRVCFVMAWRVKSSMNRAIRLAPKTGQH